LGFGNGFHKQGRHVPSALSKLNELHSLGKIDAVFYEEPLNLGLGSGMTNKETVNTLVGLAMHCESWGEAAGCRVVRAVNQSSWRKHFIGSMKRGTKSKDLKDYAMERCQQYGFRPERHDQAEAIGVLDYACSALGVVPYYRANEVLRPPLGVAR
jgi:hypothetical protein